MLHVGNAERILQHLLQTDFSRERFSTPYYCKKKLRVPKITYCVAIWGKSSIDIEHGLKGNLSKTPRCLKLDKISLKKFQSPYESVHVLMLDIPVWIINTNFSLIEVAATCVQHEPILNKMIFKAYLDKFLL